MGANAFSVPNLIFSVCSIGERWPAVQTLVPHANWQGDYVDGTTLSGGAVATCTGASGCPQLEWRGGKETAADGAATAPGEYPWWGRLVVGQLDGSGLKYQRNRFYDPLTGQFTQADPIGLAGGKNLYALAGGDPVNYTDPFGLCPMCIVGIGYALYEIGSGIYDAYNAISTALDPNASTREKTMTIGLAAVGMVAPGGGYSAGAKQIIRYGDDIVDVGLRGRSLTSGSKALRKLGLEERITNSGRHEFLDANGKVRAAYDAANSKGGNHWHKFAPDGKTPINNVGRVVDKDAPAAHIRSK